MSDMGASGISGGNAGSSTTGSGSGTGSAATGSGAGSAATGSGVGAGSGSTCGSTAGAASGAACAVVGNCCVILPSAANNSACFCVMRPLIFAMMRSRLSLKKSKALLTTLRFAGLPVCL